MKIVNDTLKNALKQPTTQRKGRILVNGNYYDVYNVEYNADAYNDGNVIGNAIASQLDFELPYIEKFDTFKYFDGIWTGSEYEYIDMGTFTVFDEKDEDDFNKHITAFDNLIKFNAPFVDVGGYPKTLFQELQNVCKQAGVVLNNTNIPNGSFRVANNQFVNEESLKTVLKAICQISGMYAIIKEDKLVLQLKNNTNEVLNKNQHEPVIWKRRTYGINQVVLGMKDVEGEYVLREDLEDIAENGVHKLVINDNPFAYTEDKRAELIDELFNQVKGFGYVPFEMNGEWLSYLDVGDTITIDGVETLLLRINGKSPKALESVMSAPAIIDSSIDYIDNTNSIENQVKKTQISVDKQNNKIELLSSQVVPVSNTIKGVRQIQLENAYEGRLHYLSIKGNISTITPVEGEYGYALVPSKTLTPSETLTPSKGVPSTNVIVGEDSILLIDDTEYNLDFKFLNYLNNDACDEFIYEDGKCKIIRRLGVDKNGELYQLENEIIELKQDIDLNIKYNSTIKLKSFDEAILETTYLLQNEYTDNFVPSVDVIARINLSPGTAQIEASKLAQITADKINLEGYTTINDGFSVDLDGNATMNNAKVNGGEIVIYDEGDVTTSNIIVYDKNGYVKNEIFSPMYKITSLLDNSSFYANLSSFGLMSSDKEIWATLNNDYIYPERLGAMIKVSRGTDSANTSTLASNGVWSSNFNNNSLESKKKNIDFDDGCLEEILNTDICSFNWKYEDDTDQKHIGCIIADESGNYKVSQKVLTHDKDAIDLYSMNGMSWKAIQELYDIIKLQEQKIKELEEKLNGIIETNKTK